MLSALALFATGVLSGCLGGQTGTEERAGGGTVADDPCEGPATPLGLDEVSALGFSAREAMNAALGTHSVGMVWRAPPDASYAFGPEMGEATLNLTLSSSATAARFVRWELNGALIARMCPPDEIQIDAMAALATSGGALSEQFPVTLRAVSSSSIRFTTQLGLEALTGSFFVSFAPGFSARGLGVEVELDPAGLRGTLRGVLEQHVGAQVSGRNLVYACFPAASASCDTQ